MTPDHEQLIGQLVLEYGVPRKAFRVMPCGDIVAALPELYTSGLWHGITEQGKLGRYVFDTYIEAMAAMYANDKIDADNPPAGNRWIKYKGAVEFSNPRR